MKINENIDNDDYLIENKINVNIHCLDNIINNQDLSETTLVKIDVQGYELKVLKGSLGILKKIKFILIEISEKEIYKNQALSSDIINFLKQKNFSYLFFFKFFHLIKFILLIKFFKFIFYYIC